jgi:hypothetical protein
VYRFTFDPEQCLLVCRLSKGGTPEENFGRHLQEMEKANKVATTHKKHLLVMVVMKFGHPVPDATWRAKVGAFLSDHGDNISLAVVSKNPVLRGVLTAVSWVTKTRIDYKMVGNLNEAGAFLSERGGKALEGLADMTARLEADSGADPA